MFIAAVSLLVSHAAARLAAGRPGASLTLVAISVILVGAVSSTLTVCLRSRRCQSALRLLPPLLWASARCVRRHRGLAAGAVVLLFDRQKVSTVRKTFYRQIMMLDPPIYSRNDRSTDI
jgi:hypothetical protein